MNKFILLLIIFFAFFVRIYNYNYPPLLWDEAALGYNAYSILNSSKDEYGKTLPLVFKSFGDYKPGFYVYLTVPFVKIFGLNELSVRLPSILLGSIMPLILYFLILKLTSKNTSLALISAFLLAISPYNIHFSRGAWESNILTFELLLASLLFFSSRYFFSSLVLVVGLYTYQSGKFFAPLFIIILYLLVRNRLKIKSFLIKFFLPFLLLSLPLLFGLIFSSDTNRLQVFSLLSYPRSPTETNQIISENSPLDYLIFHNNITFFTRNFLTRYFNHFSPRFLFTQGDWQNTRHSAPYIGVLLYPSIVFLIIGLFSLFKNKLTTINILFLIWLLIAPIPASLTRDTIQAVRSLPLSIPLIYFSSLGVYQVISYFKNRRKFLVISLILVSYLISFIYYSDLYYNHMVKRSPNDWLYGYKQAVFYLVNHQNQFDKITFSDFYGQPYIYYLFYSQYPPANYQSKSSLVINGIDVGKVESLDNIKFSTPYFNPADNTSKTLQIFSRDDALRQGIDFNLLTPLSPIDDISTFYAYPKI